MEITTKHNIDEEVYIVEKSSNGFLFPRIETIKRIQVGGKAFEEYKFDNTTRSEEGLFTDVKKVKEQAKEQAKKHYEKNLELIDDEILRKLL